jgi:hypothetical protein
MRDVRLVCADTTFSALLWNDVLPTCLGYDIEEGFGCLRAIRRVTRNFPFRLSKMRRWHLGVQGAKRDVLSRSAFSPQNPPPHPKKSRGKTKK